MSKHDELARLIAQSPTWDDRPRTPESVVGSQVYAAITAFGYRAFDRYAWSQHCDRVDRGHDDAGRLWREFRERLHEFDVPHERGVRDGIATVTFGPAAWVWQARACGLPCAICGELTWPADPQPGMRYVCENC